MHGYPPLTRLNVATSQVRRRTTTASLHPTTQCPNRMPSGRTTWWLLSRPTHPRPNSARGTSNTTVTALENAYAPAPATPLRIGVPPPGRLLSGMATPAKEQGPSSATTATRAACIEPHKLSISGRLVLQYHLQSPPTRFEAPEKPMPTPGAQIAHPPLRQKEKARNPHPLRESPDV